MRIAVMSDTHGRQLSIRMAVQKMGKIDMIIHLGDIISDALYLKKTIGIPIEYVRGNCDYQSDVPTYKEIELYGKRFYLTHGHLYDVKSGYDKLYFKAEEMKADVILFGHTHESGVFNMGNTLFVNPGSPSMPKYGRNSTIAIIDISETKIVPYILNI